MKSQQNILNSSNLSYKDFIWHGFFTVGSNVKAICKICISSKVEHKLGASNGDMIAAARTSGAFSLNRSLHRNVEIFYFYSDTDRESVGAAHVVLGSLLSDAVEPHILGRFLEVKCYDDLRS